jgi:hypothetical protein
LGNAASAFLHVRALGGAKGDWLHDIVGSCPET